MARVTDTFDKDPSAVLDFQFDWRCYTNQGEFSDWLGATETIASYTITAQTGIVKDSDDEDSGAVTVWLSGGTAGSSYTVACRIVTSLGRTDERTMLINVKDR
jgi:hypothetical protein